MKILLAESDPHIDLVLERLLASRGYTVLKATDLEEVSAVIEAEGAPPMAIVEHDLPGGGVEACRRLRQARPGVTYLVMLTAAADEVAVRSGIAAGANDLVEKPLDLLDLAARLAAGRARVEALEDLNHLVGSDPVTALWIQRGALELPRAALGSAGVAARRMMVQ